MTVNAFYLRQSALEHLIVAIPETIDYYKEDFSWMDSYFQTDDWKSQSAVQLDPELSLSIPSEGNHYDLENTVKIYTQLHNISIAQATDERLWSYLSLSRFWEYMRKRWPVDQIDANKARNYIRERYFFMMNPDRALVRHGIARLWWYGYYSYNENYEDPFTLTKILLKKLDIAQSILERNFSRNIRITQTILKVLYELEKNGIAYDERNKFRELMKYLNQMGGVTVLDFLSKEDLKKMLMKKAEVLYY